MSSSDNATKQTLSAVKDLTNFVLRHSSAPDAGISRAVSSMAKTTAASANGRARTVSASLDSKTAANNLNVKIKEEPKSNGDLLTLPVVQSSEIDMMAESDLPSHRGCDTEENRRRKQNLPKRAPEPSAPVLSINTSTPNNPLNIKPPALTDECPNSDMLSNDRVKIEEYFQVVSIQAYKCKDCHFITTEVGLLSNHLEESHQVYPTQALLPASTSFLNNLSYSSMLDGSNSDVIICTECNKTFANKKNLGSHVRSIHLQIKNHICKVCDKGFFKPSKLRKHELTHRNDNKLTHAIKTEPDQDFFLECTPDIISQNSSSSNNDSAKSDSENEEVSSHGVEMMQNTLQQGMFVDREEKSETPRVKKGGYVKKIKPFAEYILQEGPEDFTCKWCLKKFVKKYACGKHIRAVHFVERRHVCQHCQKGFFLRKSFDTHVSSRHHDVEDDCATCQSKVFHTPKYKVKRRSIKERIIVEDDGNFACKECFTKFEKMIDCVRHIRIIHFGQKRHLCNHCRKGFFSSKNLINHINSAHHDVQEQCKECKSEVKQVKKIEGGSSKVSDYLYQEDEETFICTGCEKKFSKKINCIMHIRAVHVVEKKHWCQHCPRRFFGSGDLRKHVNASHHSILDECQDCNFTLRKSVSAHQCALCSLSFPLKMLAKEHLKTHSTTCDHCSEQFDHIDRLVEHFNVLHRETVLPNNEPIISEGQHSNSRVTIKKEYSCTECDLAFTKEHGLLSHIGFAHRKSTSNVCELCHAVLSSRKILNKHMRFSHGPKNFSCEKCFKAFARKDHLAKHVRGCKGVISND